MTATMTGLDVLLDAAQGKGEAPAAAELLGWEALSLEPGYVRVRFTARETFCNGMGNIQGGRLPRGDAGRHDGARAVHAAR